MLRSRAILGWEEESGSQDEEGREEEPHHPQLAQSVVSLTPSLGPGICLRRRFWTLRIHLCSC